MSIYVCKMLNIPHKKQNKNPRVKNVASGGIPVTCQSDAFFDFYSQDNILVKIFVIYEWLPRISYYKKSNTYKNKLICQ